MPDQSGHEVIRHIDRQRLSSLVLVISGEATFAQASSVLGFACVQGFIHKPFSIEELLHSIDNARQKIALQAECLKTKAKLRKSEQLHRFFVENSPDIIYMLNAKGEFIFLNDAIERILGFSKKELRHKHFSELVHPDDLALAQNVFNERRTGKRGSREVEFRLRCADGKNHGRQVEIRALTIELSSCGIYTSRGEGDDPAFFGTYGIIRDFHDRRQAEKELIKLKLAVDHSPNITFILNKGVVIEYINHAVCKLSGFDSDDLVRQHVDILFAQDNPGSRYYPQVDVGHEPSVWRGSALYRKKNGENYWVQQAIATILDDSGQVSHFVTIAEDITETLKQRQKIAYQATHDPLTNLINRHEFARRLSRVIATAKQEQSSHVLCYLDLDRFKEVNDCCGHAAGDELLRQVTRHLAEITRKRDTVARLGGDEFAILMEHCSLDQARIITEKIHDMINEFQFHWRQQCFQIGVSIGLVLIDADQGFMNRVLEMADTACYKAKQSGRNRSYVLMPEKTDDIDVLVGGKQSWPIRVQQAMDEHQFQLHFQAVHGLVARDRPEFYEILLRLQDDDDLLLKPTGFLPGVERYDMSGAVDRWVFNEVCKCLNTQKYADITCSINLSVASILDPEFCRFVQVTVDDYQLSPKRIAFEISEMAATEHFSALLIFHTAVRAAGFGFVLDNFGHGLSSVELLKTLSVDWLKLDGRLLTSLATDAVDQQVVKAMVEIARTLDIKLVAKGVEQNATVDILETLAVPYGQGHYLSTERPFGIR